MKRIITGLLLLLCCAALAGCGKNDITLTKEENDLIAEYIAGILMKYSYENEWKYQKLNSSNSATTSDKSGQTPTKSPSQPQAVAESTQNTKASTPVKGDITENKDLLTSLPEALGLSGVTLTYKDYITGNSYPVDDYILSVPAQSGCKVVAVELKLTNTGNSAVVLNSSTGSVSIKLMAGDKNVNSYASMLKNDLTTLKNVSLSAGESKDVVVLFQVKESDANSIAGSVMSATSSGASLGSITLN